MPIILPSRYNNAPIRPADMTQSMMDLYNVVMQLNAGFSQFSYQTVIPLTGDTVRMSDDASSGVIWINPATNLSTLTLNFPSDANSVLGQTRLIASSKNVTTLTLANATVLNTTTVLNGNDCFTYMKIATGTWILCQ